MLRLAADVSQSSYQYIHKVTSATSILYDKLFISYKIRIIDNIMGKLLHGWFHYKVTVLLGSINLWSIYSAVLQFSIDLN